MNAPPEVPVVARAILLVVQALAGAVLGVVALPLWLRRVPPNPWYGVRIGATMGSPEVWYAVNARAGRELTLFAVLYVLTIAAVALMGSHASLLFVVVLPLALLLVGVVVIAVRAVAYASRLR